MTILKEPLAGQINILIDLREDFIRYNDDNIALGNLDNNELVEKILDIIEKRLLDLGHSLKGLRKRGITVTGSSGALAITVSSRFTPHVVTTASTTMDWCGIFPASLLDEMPKFLILISLIFPFKTL